MRRDELTNLYMDSLRRDPQAAPPPGLDDETAAVIRALVQSERIPPGEQLAHRVRARLWEAALQQHKENPSMTTYALPRTASRGSTIPVLYAFAALIVVLFAAALLSQPGSGGSGMPDNGGSNDNPPLLSGSADPAQQAAATQTATPIPAVGQGAANRAQIEAQIAAMQAQIAAMQAQIAQFQAVLNGEDPSVLLATVVPPDTHVIQGGIGAVAGGACAGVPMTSTGAEGHTFTWVPSIQALGSVPSGGLYGVYGVVNSLGTMAASSETIAIIQLSDTTGQVQIILPQAALQQAQIPVGGQVIVVGMMDQTQANPAAAPVFHAMMITHPGMLIEQALVINGVLPPSCAVQSPNPAPLPMGAEQPATVAPSTLAPPPSPIPSSTPLP